jgi:hypothetical protein
VLLEIQYPKIGKDTGRRVRRPMTRIVAILKPWQPILLALIIVVVMIVFIVGRSGS